MRIQARVLQALFWFKPDTTEYSDTIYLKVMTGLFIEGDIECRVDLTTTLQADELVERSIKEKVHCMLLGYVVHDCKPVLNIDNYNPAARDINRVRLYTIVSLLRKVQRGI